MYYEVDLIPLPSGVYVVKDAPNSMGWGNIDDLLSELRENIDGLCLIGKDPLPPGAKDIRSLTNKKVERVVCFEVPGRGIRYLGIRFIPKVSLHVVPSDDL